MSEKNTPVWLNPELLHFLSTLLWQAIIIWILYFYRNEVRAFLLKLTGIKLGVLELLAPIQQPSGSATKVEETEKSKGERDAAGFYTETGIKQLVQDTSPGETVVGALLFFKTSGQHTWLVATQEKLYCVLDDVDRRKTGQLVQWMLPLADAEPITVRSSDKPTYGFLDIGQEEDWYYSRDLFSGPEELKSAISDLIRKAKGFAVEQPVTR